MRPHGQLLAFASLGDCLVCVLVETVLRVKTTSCLSACITRACEEELQNSF